MSERLPVRAAFCGNEPRQLERVFGQGRRESLAQAALLHPVTLTSDNFASQRPFLGEVEILFSTWGMDADLAGKVKDLPNLKALFHAAGTVRAFARPLLDKGIVVVSAWSANAVPVAQFALSHILLGLKGWHRNVRDTRALAGPPAEAAAPGAFGETVGLLGCGMVGKRLAALLRPCDLEVLVHDPYLSEAEARELGLRKATLAEIFSRAYAVSNHLPDLPATRGLLGRTLFASLRPGAVFLNTGRGATVVEADLAAVLAERPDLTAILDVTYPEPAPPGSPWHSLPNVLLSSHIAGSNGREVARMADLCLEEFAAWQAGRPLKYQVTAAMLETLA